MGVLEEARATIERTPGVLGALLEGVPEHAATRRYAPGSFSPYHVVGHLLIGERLDWIPRLRIILEHGEARPFEPFDHGAMIEPAVGPPMAELLGSFIEARSSNLRALDAMNLSEADLERRGVHPALGAVTIGQLVSAWATHDLHHIAQLCKGLAGSNADRVGPWRAYLGILNPPS